jgi:hypothetical protein
MHLNMSLQNPSNASEGTKCIITRADQSAPVPAWLQNVSQSVLIKPVKCQRGQKMYLNMCSHAKEDKKFISTCAEQTHPVPANINFNT